LKEDGAIYFGVSAQPDESERPPVFLAQLLGKKNRLLAEGWRWCLVCRVVDPGFVIRRYKMGWIEHQTQWMFRDASHLELMWLPNFEPHPLE
jgi:hypothetical protein